MTNATIVVTAYVNKVDYFDGNNGKPFVALAFSTSTKVKNKETGNYEPVYTNFSGMVFGNQVPYVKDLQKGAIVSIAGKLQSVNTYQNRNTNKIGSEIRLMIHDVAIINKGTNGTATEHAAPGQPQLVSRDPDDDDVPF